jgi:hypothetical protein
MPLTFLKQRREPSPDFDALALGCFLLTLHSASGLTLQDNARDLHTLTTLSTNPLKTLSQLNR